MHRLVLCFFLFIGVATGAQDNRVAVQGGLVRGDSAKKELALIFTADEWGEGLSAIRQTLRKEGVSAGFFFTGRFYQNPAFGSQIRRLAKEGHYLGPHSHNHLLYCDWTRRDSLLVTRDSFETDLAQNLAAMRALRTGLQAPRLFVPPYEWWNDSIASWSLAKGLQLISLTPGIRTNADYTWPEMGPAYKSTEWILQWLHNLLERAPQTLNGAVMLIHAGTDPRRRDKLYHRLPEVIRLLRDRGFRFRRVDALFAARP